MLHNISFRPCLYIESTQQIVDAVEELIVRTSVQLSRNRLRSLRTAERAGEIQMLYNWMSLVAFLNISQP